jgi:hypothetical protein
MISDSVLNFEQVIKYDSEGSMCSDALFQIAKIRISQKDFYEAYYTLQRATKLKLNNKKMINYKVLTEGVSKTQKKITNSR